MQQRTVQLHPPWADLYGREKIFADASNYAWLIHNSSGSNDYRSDRIHILISKACFSNINTQYVTKQWNFAKRWNSNLV